MLFFLYDTTANLPVGMDSNSVNLVISVTNATLYNLFNIIDELIWQHRFVLELIKILIVFHTAKVQQFL